MIRTTANAIGAMLVALCLLGADRASAQTHPFGGQGGASGPSRTLTGPPPEARPASLWTRFNARVMAVQQTLYRQLAAAVRRLRTDGFSAFWMLAGLGFVYGVVHAAGPGHGKAVITSYVLADERTMRRGVLLSFLAAGMQAITAIVLVGVLAIVLNAAGGQIRDTVGWLETASYALIALIGAWIVWGQLRAMVRPAPAAAHAGHGHARHSHEHDRSHVHDHAHAPGETCCGHAHMPDPSQLQGPWSLRKAAAVVFAVGLRPCTGAIVVLVFALANGLFLAGVGATFAMALGTAITVSALAALAVGSKQLAVKLARGDERWAGRIYQGAGLLGGGFILLLGVTLFVGSLGPARPF